MTRRTWHGTLILSILAILTSCAQPLRQHDLVLSSKPTGLAAWNESDWKSFLAPPPAAGSAIDIKDFETILQFQNSRTQAQCKDAAREVEVSLAVFFGAPQGPLTAVELEKLSTFFWRLTGETNYVVQNVKRFWSRPRPYIADARVQPCIFKEVTMAYPSGHAAIARVYERTLVKLFPSRAQAIHARTQEITTHRILAGVHHPSDIEAGLALGDLILERMAKSAEYKQDFAKAKSVVMQQTASQ